MPPLWRKAKNCLCFAEIFETPPCGRQTTKIFNASLRQFSLRFFSKAEIGLGEKAR